VSGSPKIGTQSSGQNGGWSFTSRADVDLDGGATSDGRPPGVAHEEIRIPEHAQDLVGVAGFAMPPSAQKAWVGAASMTSVVGSPTLPMGEMRRSRPIQTGPWRTDRYRERGREMTNPMKATGVIQADAPRRASPRSTSTMSRAVDLHGDPATRRQRPVHNRDRDQDALRWTRIAALDA
jgi:hypothetical protein